MRELQRTSTFCNPGPPPPVCLPDGPQPDVMARGRDTDGREMVMWRDSPQHLPITVTWLPLAQRVGGASMQRDCWAVRSNGVW